MKKLISLLCVFVLILCTACTSTPVQSDKLQVYTSFYAMYDFTRLIGGDLVQITNLVPSGVEPHDWEPAPADMRKLESGGVFIYSGHHMESWTESVISSIKSDKLIAVETAKDIPESSDPHVWLNPNYALIQMKAICDALSDADPKNKDMYMANYQVCSEKIQKLDSAYLNAGFTKHDIVVAHEAYGHLCDKYGLKQVAVEGLQGDSDPSPAKMVKIIEFARTNNIEYIFFENDTETKVLNTIKNEIGAQTLMLNPFETGGKENKDYFTVMEENLVALTTALK